ncbi:MAG: ABC transporter permease, partial [Clostridia bacterium]|nr:ABC transporter permease [Clostridia bacterium]
LGSMFSKTDSNGSDGSSTKNTTKEKFIRALGGKNIPDVILIYPKSFDEMYKVTDYLEIWNTGDVGNEDCLILNDDGTPKLDEKGNKIYGVMINGTPYLADRPTIKATNTIEIIVGLMKKLVDIVTWALVGFTSVSLVVSTVMIGIITYVSVVERIKEIGVIRSLGGRKIDVANLFNAEAFIIGLLAGIFGIAVTYLLSLIINLVLSGIIGYSHIAALPLWQAGVLILLSVGLTCLSGIIPASSAARKDPVIALRTE